MARRLFLPLASDGAAPRPTPTVDAVRKRLGGRASTEPGAGEVVTLTGSGGAGAALVTGVVIFVRGEQVDVWLEGDVVRRVRRADTRPARSVIPPDVLAVAAAARVFAGLREGQRVGFRDDGRRVEGALVEKCRFGGLVERGDRTVVGVGFRRLHGPLGEERDPRLPLS
jgi:hypothetical protein